ncbi:MAG: O-antigen ligase family protein [Candidatus Eremiobacteraeota bacterium]|nr:O-antigen ligase family protein [Candidatus Eremiobacteraeota bacterium]
MNAAAPAGAPPSRLTVCALGVLYAILPLYGTLGGLTAGPGTPALIPRPLAAAIGILALAALATTVPAARRVVRRDRLTFAYLGPGLAVIASALVGFDPPLGLGLGLLVLGIGASGLVVARAADAAAVRLCLRVFLWSALASGALALAMVLARRPAAIYAFDNGRAVGTFLNPNELAAYTLIGLGVAVPLALASRGRDRLAALTALVLAVALAATFSRWGLFSAVCGVAAYALFARARALLAAALVVALAGIVLNAAAGARHHNPRDTEARTVAWRTGLTTFERFPLLGVGPLAFPKTYEVLRPPDAPGTRTAVAFDPHSLPIAFAADGGIVALVTLAVAFTIILRRVLRDARGAPAIPRALGYALAAAALALLIDSGINTISLIFPLILQVVTLALAVVRTDALS